MTEDDREVFDAYKALGRFSCLDGLRFFCILAVLWHHSPALVPMTDLPRILQRGFLGVDFFFVLSGFLITTLLLREEARNGRFSLRGFYWRRMLRIVPVYFFIVTAVAAYYLLIRHESQYAPLVPYYYLFLANFLTEHLPTLYPTWSLSVEEQYYLIWPLLLMVLPRQGVLPVLALLIAVNVVGAMGLLAPFGLHAFDLGVLHVALPNATYAPILIGSALALLLNDRRAFGVLLRLFGGRLMPLVAVAALLVVIALAPPDVRGLPNLAIHLLMATVLASIVLRDRNVLTPLMTFRPIARVGEISYGIYLYHLIGLHVATSLLTRLSADTPWAVFIVYSLISIGIAEISFRTLERYFRQFRRRGSAGAVVV